MKWLFLSVAICLCAQVSKQSACVDSGNRMSMLCACYKYSSMYYWDFIMVLGRYVL